MDHHSDSLIFFCIRYLLAFGDSTYIYELSYSYSSFHCFFLILLLHFYLLFSLNLDISGNSCFFLSIFLIYNFKWFLILCDRYYYNFLGFSSANFRPIEDVRFSLSAIPLQLGLEGVVLTCFMFLSLQNIENSYNVNCTPQSLKIESGSPNDYIILFSIWYFISLVVISLFQFNGIFLYIYLLCSEYMF